MIWVGTLDLEIAIENRGIATAILAMWLRDDVDCDGWCLECDSDDLRRVIGDDYLIDRMPIPDFVVMMSDGQCVAMGAHGVAKYPSWAWLQVHSGATLEHYNIEEAPEEEQWAMRIVPYGPFDGTRLVDLDAMSPLPVEEED